MRRDAVFPLRQPVLAEGGAGTASISFPADTVLLTAEEQAKYQAEQNGEWITGSLGEAVQKVYEGGTVQLLEDVSLEETLVITKSMTLTSADAASPKKISSGSSGHGYLLCVADADTPTLTLTNLVVDGGADTVDASRALVAVGGKYIGQQNNSTTTGAGSVEIPVGDSSYQPGKLILGSGAVLQNNRNTTENGVGGGVCLILGEVAMSEGAVIQNCKAEQGGAVAMAASVSSNTNRFSMEGGVMQNNQSTKEAGYGYGGGAVYLKAGTFILNGGEIKDNSAVCCGGAVYAVYMVKGSASFVMTGGTISGNSGNYGGGIYANGNSITLSGGSIVSNKANEYGGGALVAPICTLMLSGSVCIANNTATSTENGATDNLYLEGYVPNGEIKLPIVTITGALTDTVGISTWLKPGTGDLANETYLQIASGGSYTITDEDRSKLSSDDAGYAFARTESNTVVMKVAHTVTFDANGHGTAPAAQVVPDGGKAAKPADPTADGWAFKGWYTEQTCTTEYNFEDAVTKDTTLYAKWELTATHIDPIAVRYIIEHYKEDAASDTGYTLADTEYSVGEIGAEVTASPKTYDGFTYNEEKSTASGTLKAISNAEDIMTLKLYYDVTATPVTPGNTVRYIVEHYKADASSDTGYTLADTEYPAGKIGTEITAKPKAYTGFTYNEAESSNSGTLTAISNADDIVTLKLYYDVTRYAVTVDGSYAEESGAGRYAAGDTVTIHAGTREGYVFSGWTSDDGVTFAKADDETTTFVMPAGAVTVTAVFRALHGVNTENDGKEGKVTVSPDDAAEGTTVKVTAEPEDGYRFVEWKGTTISDGETVDIIFDDPTSPETTFTMPAGAVTITAVFEKVTPAAPEQAQTGLSDEAAVLLGVGIVATGAAAAAAYYYRDFLPVWKLGGVVKLPDGTPAANAAIELWRDGALVKTLTTDETGAFAARVPKGTYEAAVTWEQDGTVYTARASLTAETALAPAGPEDLIVTPEEAEPPEEPA